MPAQSNTQLITFENWTLRIRPATAQPARLLVLLHGWTGDEDSMWVFVRSFPTDYWIIAPRAPHVTQPSGYSWRPLRAVTLRQAQGDARDTQSTRTGQPSLEELRPAAEALLPWVDAYATQNKIDARQFDLIGFSQGAALTNVIALLHPERVRRAGVLAGFVPADAESLVERRPLNGKPFFVAHGTLDEMVNIEQARRSIQILERAGAQVTFCEDEVGHKLSVNCLRALESFFA